ncbi:MAG TPA: SDR family oxidoreductase [Ottowia sp.]|uniref:SDR family oxidoreductase n=1 Tax=Ottowia sp. TaxID=1898956 RepID=UPI002B82302C|nr:SDR family oxidoreductase [Ottowia sp.]HMN21445.1 SDR family oxidoreductase [Ottowia sp.]
MATPDFAGRSVLVTGAGGGLGRALALAFAGAGARVAALDLDAPALAGTSALLAARGGAHWTQACDVTDEAAVTRAVAAARATLGPLDVLVNNAGITHRSAFAATRTEVLRRVMAVNYFGALHCTHAALPDLLARRGVVVTISSVAGFAPLVARTGYAASKHALHGFMDSLRGELAPAGVRVLLVCPSFIATGIGAHALGADGAPARHPQAIVGTRSSPDAIAARILRAAARGQRLLLPDRVSRLAWWTVRLAPRFYERQMLRRLGDELRDD